MRDLRLVSYTMIMGIEATAGDSYSTSSSAVVVNNIEIEHSRSFHDLDK